MTRSIKKFKLENDGTSVVDFEEVVGEESRTEKGNREMAYEAHDDLVKSLAALDIHLAVICDEGDYTAFEENPESLEIFKTTGIVLSGSDDNVAVMLIGRKKLKTGDSLNLLTPLTKLSSAKTKYKYADTLDNSINTLLFEVEALMNGKHAPKRQMEIGFPEPEKDGEETTKKDKKPKKGKHINLADKLQEDLQANLGPDVKVEISALM